MKLKIYFFLIYVFTSLLTSAQTATESNMPGSLDSSFGNNGIVFFEGQYDGSKAVVLQQDGKIIQGGNGFHFNVGGLMLVRYNNDGSLDFSFGKNGIVITDLPRILDQIFSVGLQQDGKIIAMGSVAGADDHGGDIFLIRYNPNGIIDSSFGENGVVYTDIRYIDIPKAMVIQPDNKIVVTGATLQNYNDDQTSFTVRYLKDGALDNSFGQEGIVLTVYQQPISISSVALQANDKIVVAGYYTLSGRFVFVRYMPDGSLDTAFGKKGISVISFSNTQAGDAPYDIAVQDDGKIIASGIKYDDVVYNMMLVRIDSSGKLDSSFGEGTGNVVTLFNEGSSIASHVLLQRNGKIIASGNTSTSFALARYNTNGSLDSSFGSNGLATTYVFGSAQCTDAALQEDGKIILSGYSYMREKDTTEFTLARYNGDPTLISLAKNIKVSEGSTGYTNAVFHVQLNNTSSLPVKAKYRTVNGTAKAGRDYVADSGVVTIQPGRIMKKITIEVIGDNAEEPDRKFYLQIGEPVNAELGALTFASCTIKNDDALRTGYNNLTLPAIKISPNPVKDVLQLQGLDANSNATVTIVNLQGNVIDASTVSNSCSYTKNIAQLQHGTYYIKIQQKEKVSTIMFMKE